MIEEYTENIDTSEMIIEYYNRRKTQDLENYFIQIEEWLNRDVSAYDNKPLIIDTDVGVEKRTLLVKWMAYHQESTQKRFPDLIIPHFAGAGGKSSNYFYAMYKILIGLREHFNISQKVELIEKKILMYFNYWLELCDRTLAERIVDDSKVILVIDGIDLFRDRVSGEDTGVALWLAQNFPTRVKLIVTAAKDSEAMIHFKKNGCKVLTAATRVPQTLISNYTSSKQSFIIDENHKKKVIDILHRKSEETLNSSLFMKTYLSTLLPGPCEGFIEEKDIKKDEFRTIFRNMDYKALEKIDTIEELNTFLLNHFSKTMMEPTKFKDILIALTISEKGLSTKEILTLTKISQREWNSFVAVFETFMMKYKDLWSISEESFRKVVTQRYIQNNAEYITKLHGDIANVLAQTSNSLRKLEEETYHLYQCKAWFKLKETITNIENFLLLFNPRNKYDLCRFWQTLEQNGFDPSLEYTTAIEGFELRYRPTPEQTFMIILQISRFLQEFSDFETIYIPDYRHPPIVGGQELKQIGLKREIKQLGMYISDEVDTIEEENEGLEELGLQLAKEFPEYSDLMIQDLVRNIRDEAEKRRRKLERKQQGIIIREDEEQFYEYQEAQRKLKEQPKVKANRGLRNIFSNGANMEGTSRNNRKDLPILSTIEAMNVDIPQHREEFITFYVNQQIDKFKGRKEVAQFEQKRFDEDEEIIEDPDDPEKIQDTRDQMYGRFTDPKAPAEPNSATKRLALLQAEEKPTFYYYKRWLWMMFPWVCLSYKSNYSKIVFECFSSPTKYISVSDEKEKTMQALKLAIESKIKKELVYAKPGDKTQFEVLKNLKRNIPNLLPTGRKMVKPLPPIDKESSDLSKTRRTVTQNATSRNSLRLGDLSPVQTKDTADKILPQTTKSMKRKGNRLFVTGAYTNEERSSFSRSRDTISMRNTNKPYSLNDLPSYDEGNSMSRTGTQNTTSLKSLTFGDQRVLNMIKNADDAIDIMLRPTFLNSIFNITPKQLEMFETKVLQLKKDHNDLLALNKTNTEKLKHFHSLIDRLDGRGANDCTEKMEARMIKVNQDIVKAETLQHESMEHGRRLQLIIEICSKNRTQNELWIHNLNYLVTNFKKAIAYEEAAIDKVQRETFILQQEANKIIDEYGRKMTDHQKSVQGLKKEARKRHEIIAQVAETQAKLQGMMLNVDEDISMSEVSPHEDTTTIFTREQMERIREKERHDLDNLEEMREMIDKIRNTMGLDFESPKVNDFVENLTRMAKYKEATYDHEAAIETLQEEKATYERLLVGLKKSRMAKKLDNTGVKSEYDHIKDEKELSKIAREKRNENEYLRRTIEKNTKRVLDARNTFLKMCTKLGIEMKDKNLLIKDIPANEIVNNLEDKVREIKNSIPKEDFERFKAGKMNLERYFKDNGYDLEANIGNSFNSQESDKENSLKNEGAILERSEAEFSESQPCEA